MEYAVILFHATSHAMRAEKLVHTAGMPCRLIPVPRRFSSDCGVCLRVERIDQERAAAILKQGNIEIVAAHDL